MSGQLKNDAGERKLRVTLLSAEWKASSNGDLTTINRELAIQMAKHPNVEVSVFLPQCSEEDKKDADSYNVKLIEAVKVPGLKPVFWLACVPDGHAMDCVLGHGVALGQQILLIKRNPNYSHCKWIQVIHTAPEEIGMFKSISEGQQMQQTEVELCEMADQVVTIGPKLTDAYRRQLRKQDVFNLTPSILTEFSDVQQASEERRTFCVLLTESGNREDFDVKGYDIAMKAIAKLEDKSYQLRFASKERGKEDELADKSLQCGIGRNQLIICSFDENRETLANLLSAVDIAILPSKTEGFGLSSLEAISAGLPILVSGNSGIAEALREVPNGSQCIVDSEDPADWARAIKAVRDKKRKVRLAEAKILRENYLQQFSWEEPCNFLVKKMYSLAFGVELNVKVDVDDLKPEEQNMQTGMLAIESVRCQEVQQPRTSATSAASGSVSDPQTEDLKALKEKTFLSIITNSFYSTKPQSIEEWNWFKEFAKEMKVTIIGVSEGSLVITVRCESLMILEELWTDYSSGRLDEVVQNCFVTEKILKELNLADLRLKTTMDKEEYNACKMFFEKDALRGAVSSEFHSTSSTSESPQKKEQWEKSEQKTKIMRTAKLEGASSSEFHSISSTSESPQNQEELKKWKQETKIVETEKQKGTSPLTVEPTTGHGKELIEKEQRRKGILPPHGSSTSDPQEKLEELRMNLKKQVTCSICLDTFTEPKIISCHHTFCCECLERHARVSQRQGKFRCPECQVEISLPEGNHFDCLPNSFLHKSLLSVLQAESCEGTSPSNELSTAGHKKKWEVRHNTGKFQEKEGSSPPPLLSTTDLEEKIGKVCEDIKMLRMEGSSPPVVSTVEVELEELVKKLQKGRLEGSSPPPLLSTTDLEEKLGKVCKDIKMLRMEGSSPPPVSTVEVELEEQQEELLEKLQKGRLEGSSPPPLLSTTDLEEKLGKVCEEIKMLRMGGSSPPPVSTVVVELEELLEKLQKGRMEGALSSEFHSTSSTSPQKKEQWEKSEQKTKIIGTAKLEGTSPLTVVPTTGYGKELEEPWGRKGMLPLPGSSIFGPEEELVEPRMKLQRIKGALSSEFHSISSTSESPQNQEVLKKRKQKTKIDEKALENAMYPTIRSGLAKFDVSLPEELQNYVSYLLNESAKLHFRKQVLQSPRALEELRVAMDKDELKAFLTIHIREGAWQVVLLFTDELSISKQPWYCFRVIYNEDEDEDEDEEVSNEVIYSSISGILYGWPTEYDPDLITLCKAITNRDWKVTRLILSRSRISDEGLKNLSTALPQSELYSLTLYGIGLQNQGLKHLCEALIISDCHLTSLNVSHNMLGDEGIMHLRDALANVNCRLTTLNVSHNRLGDEGIVLLSNALTSVNCHLTSLNVSHNMLRDEGIVHLRDALASVNCRLTTLNVSHNRLGDEGIVLLSHALTSVNCGLTTLNVRENSWGDEGIVYLGNALTSIDCTLTSLNVSNNWLGDEGIVHLCNALTSVNCTLTSLNVSNNWLRDEGIMYLCNALTSVNCTLTSLNVSNNWLGDEGIMHLCNALTSVNCRLTSLNASHIRWEDNGFKHLCDALTSSNCVLTKLKIGLIRLGDGGIKELSEVLTNGFCTLTSLDISNNEFGDEGIKHLCKALTDTNCKLRSLDYHGNRNVTDKGRKYLSQMLTGTDWEVRGAQLSRSTTK